MWCDFHLHSHHSDGALSPSGLVDVVADAGIRIMALTDHDTTAGLPEAFARARDRGVIFVNGIEMTAYASGQVVHILGLAIAERDVAIAVANEVALGVWEANERRWIESLERDGFAVSVERDFPDLPVRLPILISRLCGRGVEGGDARRCHARFRDFFRALPSDAYEQLPSPARAAQTIRGAAGVAILAHPARLNEIGLAEQFLDDLDGVEAMYAHYERPQRESLRLLARARGKFYSGGSDYHGFFDKRYLNPRFEILPDFMARLGARPVAD